MAAAAVRAAQGPADHPARPATLPSRMSDQQINVYVLGLVERYQARIKLSAIGPLLTELAQLAQKDPRFHTGNEKKEWVMKVFTRTVSQILERREDQPRKEAIMGSAESLLSGFKHFYKNSIAPAPGAAAAPAVIKSRIIEENRESLLGLARDGVQRKDIGPLLIRIFSLTAPIGSLTDPEISALQKDIANEVLDLACPNRGLDPGEAMLLLSMKAMVPSAISSLTMANRRTVDLAEGQKSYFCGCIKV